MTPETLAQIGADFDDVFFLIGGAMLFIEIVKALFTRQYGWRGYADMIASISTQIPYLLVEIGILSFAYLGFQMLSDQFVTWSLPLTTGTVLLALLAADFTYYWEHRIAHKVRLLWTQHAVHHSSRFMNISVGVRFGPLESVWSAIAHLPLLFLGLPAEAIFFGIIVVLAYQTWIHTELIGKLGALDEVLNTPANHRVHHGCDEKYIDKNFGGILIIWDRIFGSFQREEETPVYGLKRDYHSVNPFSVWFSELPEFFANVAKSPTLGAALGYMFGRPGVKE